jgi:hypothetical protein
MNNNSQSDLAKHVARVIRSMNRRRSARGESTTGESDGPSLESEVEPLSSGEIASPGEDTARYPAWIEHL